MRRTVPLALALAAAAATAVFAAAASHWQQLPTSPLGTPYEASAVWTGSEMVVFARTQPHPPNSVDAAAAYHPATHSWTTLTPFHGPRGSYNGSYQTLWTGRAVIVLGPVDAQAYYPRRNRWRRLRHGAESNSLLVWTGHRVISWGGGCCGSETAAGSIFNLRTNRWHPIAASPLAPSDSPAGAWDGHEMIVLVSGIDPFGHPYPASDARAAAYNPATNQWRRIAQPPVSGGGTGIWDGRDVLFVGAPTGLAYSPATDRWRTLRRMPARRRSDASVTHAGRRVLVWGGSAAGRTGLEYIPRANHWLSFGRAPIPSSSYPVTAWTGRTFLIVGGLGASGGASWTP